MRSLDCEGISSVVFISERSEFELIGNGHDRTALQNRCGLEQMGGGDAELGTSGK